MYNDIQILVQGYYWNQNVINENFKDVSFFNPIYTEWTSRLDITPYIIKDSLSALTFDLALPCDSTMLCQVLWYVLW